MRGHWRGRPRPKPISWATTYDDDGGGYDGEDDDGEDVDGGDDDEAIGESSQDLSSQSSPPSLDSSSTQEHTIFLIPVNQKIF